MTGQMSKADGRRSTRHASYYDSLPPRIAKRKDRNVRRSVHLSANHWTTFVPCPRDYSGLL